MAPFRLKTDSCFALKAIDWNRCCLRYKHILNSTDHDMKFNLETYPPSQDGATDEVEGEMCFPFINPIKTIDHTKSLASLSRNPLMFQYASRNLSSGRRIYLDKFDTVTSILNQTKPAKEKFALLKWTEAQVSELGKKEFLKKKKDIVKRGTSFHHDMHMFFQNKEDPKTLSGPSLGYWQSIHHVLKDITNVVAIESCVAHPRLGYAGKVDLIGEYKGALSVIDWKTSGKRRLSLKDCFSYPQQVAAYVGAVNFDKNYPFQVFEGLIVTVYQDGFPADVHHISQEMLAGYWDTWLARLHQYRRRFPQIELDTRHTEKEAQHFNTMADCFSAKSVNSIGTPLAKLGALVKDEDVIKEEQFQKKNASSLFSWLERLRIGSGWKESCREFLQSFRFRGKNE